MNDLWTIVLDALKAFSPATTLLLIGAGGAIYWLASRLDAKESENKELHKLLYSVAQGSKLLREKRSGKSDPPSSPPPSS